MCPNEIVKHFDFICYEGIVSGSSEKHCNVHSIPRERKTHVENIKSCHGKEYPVHKLRFADCQSAGRCMFR